MQGEERKPLFEITAVLAKRFHNLYYLSIMIPRVLVSRLGSVC